MFDGLSLEHSLQLFVMISVTSTMCKMQSQFGQVEDGCLDELLLKEAWKTCLGE